MILILISYLKLDPSWSSSKVGTRVVGHSPLPLLRLYRQKFDAGKAILETQVVGDPSGVERRVLWINAAKSMHEWIRDKYKNMRDDTAETRRWGRLDSEPTTYGL